MPVMRMRSTRWRLRCQRQSAIYLCEPEGLRDVEGPKSRLIRRTKIVATLGPSTREPDVIRSLLEAGVDVFRLNFAHSTPAVHRQTAETARQQARQLGRTIGILVDLPGPKMRTGPIEEEQVELVPGATFTLTSKPVVGDVNMVSTTVDDLPGMVRIGDEIYLADGEIVLRVAAIGDDVLAEIVRGGVLRSRKGLHLPRAERHVRAFTPEDHVALQVALDLKADLVGVSFVLEANDIRRVRAALPKRGHRPLVVAKIETAAALDALDEVVGEADAVMVARGDLGIQMPLERVPFLQKEIIRTCNMAGIPVITATQMLESMTHARLPTRAEVTDVANAVLDGADALMLSEETAIGAYPIEVVRVMDSIIETAEAAPREHHSPGGLTEREDSVSWAVARAAVQAAHDLNVAAIVCPTQSGATARKVAAFRPRMPVLALSTRADTLGALTLTWGTTPLLIEHPIDPSETVKTAIDLVRKSGLVSAGRLVTIVAGSTGPRAGTTDFMRIMRC